MEDTVFIVNGFGFEAETGAPFIVATINGRSGYRFVSDGRRWLNNGVEINESESDIVKQVWDMESAKLPKRESLRSTLMREESEKTI